MNKEQVLRKAMLDFLDRPHTHAQFKEATAGFPESAMNKKLPGVPYTAWGLLEHIRRTQRDMIDFMVNKDYEGMEWPKDYWPAKNEKATKKMWQESAAQYEKDFKKLKSIISNPKNDLFAKIPWGEGQTKLREVLQIIDHTGYHIGELVMMRRMMGEWKQHGGRAF